MKTTLVLAALLAASPALRAQDEAEPSLPYTVQRSDKLIRLARGLLRQPSDWSEVARFNRMRDPNLIQPGQVLNIPLRLLRSKAANARVISAYGTVTLDDKQTAADEVVPEGARLQTGPDSTAVIELGDGSRVKLMPRTLAEVAANREYAMRQSGASDFVSWFAGSMRLITGQMEAVASKIPYRARPLQINTIVSSFAVRGTQFRVAYEDPARRTARTEVTEGLVQADNPAQGARVEVPAGKGALVDPAEREIKVVVLLPAPDLSALPAQVFKPQANVPLPALPGASGFHVQVASDDKFDRIVRDVKLPPGAAIELGALALASWNLRVRGIDALGVEGLDAVRQVMVRVLLRITDSSMRVENGRTLLRFQPDVPVSGPMALTLARDSAMSQPVMQATLAEPVWDLGALPEGRYYLQYRMGTPGSPSEVYEMEISSSWGLTVFDSVYPLHPPR